jgi:hypothetical protein
VSDESATTRLDGYWRELVAVAVLGTERRDPPAPPAGAIADLLADTAAVGGGDRPTDAAAELLDAVAATTAVRRAAFLPEPPLDRLAPPPDDPRPWCSAAAATTWRTVVSEWPVLEDEWIETLVERGLALPPDLVVELLVRHRADGARRSRVVRAAGPLAVWLVDLVPALAGSSSRSSGRTTRPDPEPAPARSAAAESPTFVDRLRAAVVDGTGPPIPGPVLVGSIARCHPGALAEVIDVLDEARHPLAGLARLRQRMLIELAGSER